MEIAVNMVIIEWLASFKSHKRNKENAKNVEDWDIRRKHVKSKTNVAFVVK